MMKRKSVKQKYRGFSFAQAATKIGTKYPSRDFDSIAARSFMNEMGQLIALQDMSRAKEQAMNSIQDYRRPVNASKYKFGGGIGSINNAIPTLEQDLSMQGQVPLSLFGNVQGPDLSGVSYQPMGISPTIPKKYGNMQGAALDKLPTSVPTSVQSMYAGKPQLPTSPLQGVQDALAGGAGSESGGNIYKPLAIGKGIEFLTKAAMTASGATKVSPEYNPYEDQVRSTMASRAFNNDALKNLILGQQNAANANVAGIPNSSVQQALRQNSLSQGISGLAQNEMAMQQGNNSLKGESAQVLNNLGQQRAAANNYAEQLNNQGLASQQMSLQSLAESVGNVGQRLTDYRAGIAQQNLLASALSTTDFQFGDVASVIKDAVNMRKLDPMKAIQIVESSKGKSKDQVVNEVQQAVQEFRNSFNK